MTRADLLDADLVLRCVWLRAHADLLVEVDPSGLLSAQLRDLADLLERRDSAGAMADG